MSNLGILCMEIDAYIEDVKPVEATSLKLTPFAIIVVLIINSLICLHVYDDCKKSLIALKSLIDNTLK